MRYLPMKLYHPRGLELAGFIPGFLDEDDARTAAEQLDKNYAHGGGWSPLSGWKFNPEDSSIKYPGDPALRPVVELSLRDERVLIYKHAWVAIVQKDGKFEVARMD